MSLPACLSPQNVRKVVRLFVSGTDLSWWSQNGRFEQSWAASTGQLNLAFQRDCPSRTSLHCYRFALPQFQAPNSDSSRSLLRRDGIQLAVRAQMVFRHSGSATYWIPSLCWNYWCFQMRPSSACWLRWGDDLHPIVSRGAWWCCSFDGLAWVKIREKEPFR